MAESLKTKVRTVTTTTGPNPEDKKLASELQMKGSQQYLDELEALSSDPQYAQTVPPNTQQSLKAAIDQARDAYQAKVTRNEWLDVAQTLGRAVTQFGAAQSGMKSGRDMSNIDMGPRIDFNSRSDQAFREYSQDLKNAGDQDSLARQGFLDSEKAKHGEYGRKEGYLKEALKTAREREGDDQRMKRTQEMETTRFNRESSREKEREGRDNARKSEQDRKLELAELDKQEKSLANVLKARTTARNNSQLVEDLGKKSADKLEAGYGRLLGEADLNIADVKATKPGMLWGTNPDPEKSKQILDTKVAEVKNMLDAVKKRKAELIGSKSQPSAAPAADKAPPAPKQDAKIDEYAKQYKLSYEDAKKVLVGRGYTPAE